MNFHLISPPTAKQKEFYFSRLTNDANILFKYFPFDKFR